MANRVNRAIELLSQDQPIYYMGGHTGHVLTYEQGKEDAKTWADYIGTMTLAITGPRPKIPYRPPTGATRYSPTGPGPKA